MVVPATSVGHKRRLDRLSIIVLVNFHYPIGNVASTSSFSSFPFLLYWPDFSFFVVCSRQTFHSRSKSFHYDYESFAFSSISRPYPSHTCLVLHIWALTHQFYALRRKSPHDTINFLREHLEKSRIKRLPPKFPFIIFPLYDQSFPFLRASSATQILCPVILQRPTYNLSLRPTLP